MLKRAGRRVASEMPRQLVVLLAEHELVSEAAVNERISTSHPGLVSRVFDGKLHALVTRNAPLAKCRQ